MQARTANLTAIAPRRLAVVALLNLALLSGQTRAAISVVDALSPEASGTSTSISAPVKVSPGANVLVVLLATMNSSGTYSDPASLTWNGQTLNQVVSGISPVSTYRRASIYYLYNPTTEGTVRTLTGTGATGTAFWELKYFTLSSVDTNVPPLTGWAGGPNGTTNLSFAVTNCPDNGWAAVCATWSSTNALTVTFSGTGGAATSVSDYLNSGSPRSAVGMGYISGLTPAGIFTASVTNGNKCAFAAAVFKPGGGVTSLVITNVTMVGATVRFGVQSALGITNQIQCCTNLSQTSWVVLTNLLVEQSPYYFVDVTVPPVPMRFYRVLELGRNSPVPSGMDLIPASSFLMGATTNMGHEYYTSVGNCSGGEVPQHMVYVSAFYMDRYEVTKALWDDVYSWAITHNYSFDNPGLGEAITYPVQSVNWYDCVKWCNARSQKEGLGPCYYNEAGLMTVYKSGTGTPYPKWDANGYRLPTEAEWEKAARGGVAGYRFSWLYADTINWSRANYYSYWSGAAPYYPYDVNQSSGFNPAWQGGGTPYTTPVGSFAANWYGLYDMAGNVWEWCWDWYASTYYRSSPGTNPRGPASGLYRVIRGGSWNSHPHNSRTAYRYSYGPLDGSSNMGFRCVRPAM